MLVGTVIARRTDGAVLVYAGSENPTGLKTVHMGKILLDGAPDTAHPLLTILVHGYWDLEVDENEVEQLITD